MKLFVGSASIIFALVNSNFLVDGHGYVKSPRDRSFVAHEDGVSCRNCNSVPAGTPKIENCFYCNNRKEDFGVCGETRTQSYENGKWADVHGDPMPWTSEATLTAGETYEFTTELYAHHQGHMELRGCPMCPLASGATSDCFIEGELPTQECFDNNPLTFWEDIENTSGKTGDANFLPAKRDLAHPERGYYSPDLDANSETNPIYKFIYQVPSTFTEGKEGKVLLQYTYVTANSCNSQGYHEYFAAAGTNYSEWWSPNLADCSEFSNPFTGEWRKCKCGERFWSCVEVSVQ